MTIIEFLNKLNSIEPKPNTIATVYHSFLSDLDDASQKDYDEANNLMRTLSEEEFASLGMKLGRCLANYQEEEDTISIIADTHYATTLKKAGELIKKIVSIYNDVASLRASKDDNVKTAEKQNDAYLLEVKEKLKNLNDDVSKANALIDDKIFSLLINTVTILGIFVAIAFTGFGVTSIFTSVDYNLAFTSHGNFIKMLFFLLLVSFMSYNLLLLLVYFVYKLSRPLITKIKIDDDGNEKQETFFKTVNLTPFLWIDGIMLIITLVLFICCQFV